MSLYSCSCWNPSTVPFTNGSQYLWRTAGPVPKGVKVGNCDPVRSGHIRRQGRKGGRVWKTGLAAKEGWSRGVASKVNLARWLVTPRKYRLGNTLMVMPHWLACLRRKCLVWLWGLNKPVICLDVLGFSLFILIRCYEVIWARGGGSGNEGNVLAIRPWMGLVGSF